ncbi:transmembrane protein 42-like isoform X1 [Mytilus edulis]|uniref:transmembrane protein 42-like isoform X1 n=2 Tax=Mytilus edulis TaxID=6550 RepID=UPI0039EFD750
MKKMQWLRQSHGLTLAVMAGVMASLGSTFAKLAMSGDIVLSYCLLLAGNHKCQQISVYIQVLFFLMIFVCNGVMWTFFTKSLQYCSSSVEATVTNTASNFLFTAFVGLLLFDETLSLRWWFGSLLILLGLMLINRGNLKDELRKADTKTE